MAKIIFITTHTEMTSLTLKWQVEALDFIVKDQDYDQLRSEIAENLNIVYERLNQRNLTSKKIYSFDMSN